MAPYHSILWNLCEQSFNGQRNNFQIFNCTQHFEEHLYSYILTHVSWFFSSAKFQEVKLLSHGASALLSPWMSTAEFPSRRVAEIHTQHILKTVSRNYNVTHLPNRAQMWAPGHTTADGMAWLWQRGRFSSWKYVRHSYRESNSNSPDLQTTNNYSCPPCMFVTVTCPLKKKKAQPGYF